LELHFSFSNKHHWKKEEYDFIKILAFFDLPTFYDSKGEKNDAVFMTRFFDRSMLLKLTASHKEAVFDA
jgi:hypothetical protein